MKKQFIVLSLLLILVNVFFYYGMPYLKHLRQDKEEGFSLHTESPGVIDPRAVTVNISVEPICVNMVTGEPYSKCNEKYCEDTCQREGCEYFSLYYDSSSFEKHSCLCHCLEENKNKKALSGQ